MKPNEILEGNYLICKFEGEKMKKRNFPDADENEYFVIGELKYHCSWDWLIPIG